MPAEVLTWSSLVISVGCLIYVLYIYVTIYVPIERRFPEPVANKLKRALYYSDQQLDIPKAWNYYMQVLQLGEEHGMHPFSEEIIGVKLTMIVLLERVNYFDQAIELLENLKSDCKFYFEAVDGHEDKMGDRARMLSKVIRMSVKLGELYGNVYVQDEEAAQRNLTEGVELSLKEQQRRDEEGVGPEEGPWMEEEMGPTLEGMALELTEVTGTDDKQHWRITTSEDPHTTSLRPYTSAPSAFRQQTVILLC